MPADRIESNVSGKVTETAATNDDSKGDEKAASPAEESQKPVADAE